MSSGTGAPPGHDTIYAAGAAAEGEFRFDARVASVFENMIGRSVPGYALTLQMLAVAARRFAQPGSRCYDLGCSLGASTLAIARHAPAGVRVVGVDNSPQMLERARTIIDAEKLPNAIELRCEDLRHTSLADAALVSLNFTLQFVPVAERLPLLGGARAALREGGCLVLSEKLAFEDPREQALLAGLHHDFKALQGYSALEIAGKRAALENVLIPETLQAHRARLREAGFRQVTVWLQCLNFVSLLAEP